MSRKLHLIGIMANIGLVALFALLPIAGAAPRAAETKNVSAKDFEFDPKTITVNVGDTIVWKNVGQRPHTVDADDGSFDSGTLQPGQEFSFTFSKAGTFPYYCEFHGAKGGSGMAGTVVVQEAAAAQPTAAPAQPTAAPAGAAPTGSLDVSNQPVRNGTITVASATISVDGWVVVHKAGPDGKLLLTPVIGMTQLKAGTTRNVVINLTEAVAEGAPLWPMLHVDVGTKGTYEFPNGPDVPVGSERATVQIMVTAAGAAGGQLPAGGGPTQLPRTGGEEAPIALLLGALALVVVGALVMRRTRRA